MFAIAVSFLKLVTKVPAKISHFSVSPYIVSSANETGNIHVKESTTFPRSCLGNFTNHNFCTTFDHSFHRLIVIFEIFRSIRT